MILWLCGFQQILKCMNCQVQREGLPVWIVRSRHLVLASNAFISVNLAWSRLVRRLHQPACNHSAIMSTPRPLQLYTFVQRSQVDDCISKNILEIPPHWWHIGLRESPEEAVRRAGQAGEPVAKDTHVILKVIFSTLGVAHFVTTYEDKSYHFQPILSKYCKWNAKHDKGAWHFIRNLPLTLNDDQGNILVTTEWIEIEWARLEIIWARQPIVPKKLATYCREQFWS